jgi:polysaccharide biosynthesis transport protein
MLSTEPVAGTQVVQPWAVGEAPEVLPFLLNELISIYQTKVGERFVDSSTKALDQARDETDRYKTAILKLRGEIEGFRNRHGIVSKERDENEATARAKGLNAAINAAEEKAIAAQSKLGSLRAAIAAGKGATRAKDNPTLASLEQRLSQAREDLKQLERRYTAAYLARERDAMALKTKIPELEQGARAAFGERRTPPSGPRTIARYIFRLRPAASGSPELPESAPPPAPHRRDSLAGSLPVRA